MNVESILRNKGGAVATVAPNKTIREATALLRRERIGALVVSSDGAKVDGILSERDIVHGLADRGAPLLDATVERVDDAARLHLHAARQRRRSDGDDDRAAHPAHSRGEGRHSRRHCQHRRRGEASARRDRVRGELAAQFHRRRLIARGKRPGLEARLEMRRGFRLLFVVLARGGRACAPPLTFEQVATTLPPVAGRGADLRLPRLSTMRARPGRACSSTAPMSARSARAMSSARRSRPGPTTSPSRARGSTPTRTRSSLPRAGRPSTPRSKRCAASILPPTARRRSPPTSSCSSIPTRRGARWRGAGIRRSA